MKNDKFDVKWVYDAKIDERGKLIDVETGTTIEATIGNYLEGIPLQLTIEFKSHEFGKPRKYYRLMHFTKSMYKDFINSIKGKK